MDALLDIPIQIARVLITLRSPLTVKELGIEERLGPFFASETQETPLYRVSLRWEDSRQAPTPPGDLLYDPGKVWKMYRHGLDTYACLFYAEPQARSMLRANPAWDDLTLTEQRRGDPWQSLLNLGAGELILRTGTIAIGGLVFHASGVDDNGKGLVFIGHAEIGKSTQQNLWCQEPGVLALNEDGIAVQMGDGVPMCHGIPWRGTPGVSRNHAAPLSALILLEQAPENTIKQLTAAVAAPLLMARAFLPYWDQDLMQQAMANLDAILKRVPIFRLRCRPEKAVIPLVRSVL